MYEEIVKFIRDKNRFSPTILYDILRSEYMIDYRDYSKNMQGVRL